VAHPVEPRPLGVATLLLAAWLGAALLAAAVVAPAAFAVLPTRALAGALVGRVLPPLFFVGATAGLLVAAQAWRGRAFRAAAARVALGVAVAVACLAAQLVVAPRIERLRETIGGPVDALPRADARRVAFGRLHALSVAALGVAMLSGGAALVLGVARSGAREGGAAFGSRAREP